jgi:hypothetical protein
LNYHSVLPTARRWACRSGFSTLLGSAA